MFIAGMAQLIRHLNTHEATQKNTRMSMATFMLIIGGIGCFITLIIPFFARSSVAHVSNTSIFVSMCTTFSASLLCFMATLFLSCYAPPIKSVPFYKKMGILGATLISLTIIALWALALLEATNTGKNPSGFTTELLLTPTLFIGILGYIALLTSLISRLLHHQNIKQ